MEENIWLYYDEIRYNRELYDMLKLEPVTSYIKGQRIQLLGTYAT